MRVGYSVSISYPSSVPPNIVIKASLNNSDAGRELGREPPPVGPLAAASGDRKAPVPVDGLFKGIVSSEGGREGLGVRTLKQKVRTVTSLGVYERHHVDNRLIFRV